MEFVLSCLAFLIVFNVAQIVIAILRYIGDEIYWRYQHKC